jgi:hypothetical protein
LIGSANVQPFSFLPNLFSAFQEIFETKNSHKKLTANMLKNYPTLKADGKDTTP